MNSIKSLLYLGILALVFSCSEPVDYSKAITDGHYLSEAQNRITEVIIHDIFSPPVAARIYSYSSLAAYEVAAAVDPNYQSLLGQLNDSEEVKFTVPQNIYAPLASLAAYYAMGTHMIFSEEMVNAHRDKTFEELKEKGIPEDVFEASVDFGKQVAEAVKAYSSKDNYHQSRSFPKYTVTNLPGTWEPTPPAYMEAIEPHWNKIRIFALDSAAQYKVSPPPPYSTDPNSEFFQRAKEVYEAVNQSDKEELDIAMFWDCNPYKMNIKGHVMFAQKKITPGGHWMSIAAISAKTAKADWKKTAEALVLTGISLHDAFVACWDEKYRSKLVRPETYINEFIDEEWVPVLQTPPFPEHTSGHSVASTAAAHTLTQLFGEEFHFVDSSEVNYGLPVREYNSFSEAAQEAAISRFYGGIHYLPAIEEGIWQGQKVGEHLWSKISTKSKNLAENK